MIARRLLRIVSILFALASAAPVAHAQPALTELEPFQLDFGQPDPSQKPAQPEHTGLKALVFETLNDFKSWPQRQSTWVFLGVGAGAALAVHPADDSLNAHLEGSTADKIFAPGKYIGSFYTQAGVAVGLYVVGRYMMKPDEGTHTNKVAHLGFDLLRTVFITEGITQGMKVIAQRDRPTGACCSFPSGHASATFATASVIERHLGYRAAWPTYVIASYVAMSRLHDNVHFVSDVVFGSALGISTGWTVVGRHGRTNFTMMPVPVRGGVMLSVMRIERDKTAERP